MIKIATIDDVQTIKDMALEFMKTTNYVDYYSEDKIERIILDLINGPSHEKIILLNEGGFIAGAVSSFLFGNVLQATEIAWWVKPLYRKTGLGKTLLDGFEYWAKEVAGCTIITMSTLDDKLGKFYEKNDYKLYERAYMKGL